MELTVIIVSYNVKHYLYQCLDSVCKATKNIQAEIIVVDNHSSDQSATMVTEEFPQVVVIENDLNVGFGRANNQALAIAKGKFTLFLNPDTIVPEDCFQNCLDFINSTEKVCSLGIKMIDGSGAFLPESKRSFPSPEVAFYKLFGLSKLFPKHEQFGKYHLGFLSKNENHVVEVISGAFLLVETAKLKQKGGFDEDFFMYGEDIDLSHRLLDNGCKNWYFAESTILHYKGESTRKGSLNYVKNFYEAMIIFARKHLESSQAKLFTWIMKLAILVRGLITLVASFIKRMGLQIIDTVFILLSMFLAKQIWESVNPKINDYSPTTFGINFSVYLLIFLFTMFFSGAYDRPFRLFKIIRGAIVSAAIILIFHLFFPKQHQFSRFFILLTAFIVGLCYTLVRLAIQYSKTNQFSLYGSLKKRVLFVGNEHTLHYDNDEFLPPPHYNFLGLVSDDTHHQKQIGKLNELADIVQQFRPTDVLFDTSVLSYKQIIQWIESLHQSKVRCHTMIKHDTIISSHDKNNVGSVFVPEKMYAIAKPEEIRKKRLLDILTAIIALVGFPILFWLQNNSLQYLKNCVKTFFGQATWVGYSNDELPKLKEAIIQVSPYKNEVISKEIESNYAKYYSVYEDIDILQRNWKQLGTKP